MYYDCLLFNCLTTTTESHSQRPKDTQKLLKKIVKGTKKTREKKEQRRGDEIPSDTLMRIDENTCKTRTKTFIVFLTFLYKIYVRISLKCNRSQTNDSTMKLLLFIYIYIHMPLYKGRQTVKQTDICDHFCYICIFV